MFLKFPTGLNLQVVLTAGVSAEHGFIFFNAFTSSQVTFLDDVKYAEPGGRLNKKDGLTRYGDSHVKDKTS